MNNRRLCRSSYREDGRHTLWELYKRYSKLEDGWSREVIYWQKSTEGEFPALLFKTKKKGPALWVLSGIHGEEPAGPNALYENINILQQLKNENIPVVFIPMCNPLGYFKNWRYPNEYRDYNNGTSVGDSEHLLFNDDYHPRRLSPACSDADQLTKAVLKNINPRPPILSMDFHEDEDSRGSNTFSYIYSQGKMGVADPIAKMVVEILTGHDVLLQKNGVTRFGDIIVDGIVNASKDGSIDELLASNVIYKNNSMILKHPTKTVIVVETPSVGVPLEKRVIAHSEIIHHLEMFFHMACEGY